MKLGYVLILSFLAGISTIIGCVFILLPISKDKINKFISFCLAFSLSVMINISIFDILPTSFIGVYNYMKSYTFLLLIFIFIICIFIIKKIDLLTFKYENNLYKLGILSMIILIMHNLPEGIITFLSTYYNSKLGIKLSLAIALHNIPEGIAIAIPIYYATRSYKKSFLKTFISGMSEPLGAIIAYLFLAKYVTNEMLNIFLMIVGALMITLSIEELLPEAIKYNESKSLIFGIATGIIVVMLSINL